MKKLFLLGALASALSLPAQAALNILATVPEWAALARELGGSRVTVNAATTGLQDPHRIEAKPSLIAKARAANLVVATGAELEIGWLPVVLRESGNRAIQPGMPGYFEAAAAVTMLDVPKVLDRAHGDVHAAGNPHIQTDPRNILKVAEALTARMIELDPAEAMAYRTALKEFEVKWRAAIVRWEKEAAPLKGVPVLVQHKTWSYLVDWLGLKVVADLEPKPGVDPSAAYLGQLLDRLKTQPARMVLRAGYLSPKAGEWIAAKAGVRVVTLPYTVGGSERARDLISLYDDILERLTEAAR